MQQRTGGCMPKCFIAMAGVAKSAVVASTCRFTTASSAVVVEVTLLRTSSRSALTVIERYTVNPLADFRTVAIRIALPPPYTLKNHPIPSRNVGKIAALLNFFISVAQSRSHAASEGATIPPMIEDSAAEKTSGSGERPFGYRRELGVTIVLFVASNLLVLTFAAMTHWLSGAPRTNIVDFCRADCNWFSIIVEQGYELTPNFALHRGMTDWAFFPLFPATALPFRYLLGLRTPIAIVITSRLELFAAIFSFLLLVEDEVKDETELLAAGALVAFNPYLIYAYAGYSEPLYFTIVALGFVYLRRRQWISAGICGALVSATRIVGSAFLVAYLLFTLQIGWRGLAQKYKAPVLLGLALCPVGVIAYSTYLHFHMGDALAFLHVQAAFGRHVGNPVVTVANALGSHHWQKLWGAMAIGGLCAVAWLVQRREWALGAYLFLAILIPLCADTWGLPRYLWWQPQLLFALFTFLKRWRTGWILYFPFAGAMISFMIFAWFSGSNIVV